MKKVSIIIPAYNCEKTLVECLGNVVHQSLKDIEVIIVDDASTDGTWNIIAECERQFPDLIMAIKSEVNSGPGGARNIGLMYASGEYIGFVDSDDRIDDDYLTQAKKLCFSNYDLYQMNYKVIDDMKKNVKDWESEEEVTAYLKALLRKEAFDHQGLIYGMGHAVYSISDPRAVAFKQFVEKLANEKEVEAQ